MAEKYHLIVEQGADKGKKIFIPPDGARVGRSSGNDIMLNDPALSRYNNRFFFKQDDGGLWVADLDSANGTLVNGKTVQEVKLNPGDRVLIGETTLLVADTGIDGCTTEPAEIDLGFKSSEKSTENKKANNSKINILIIVLVVFAAITLFIWGRKLINENSSDIPKEHVVQEAVHEPLEINYEKVHATTNNIFRYYLQLKPDGTMSVQIDDLVNNRHIRKEGHVDREYMDDLIRKIKDSGFFGLNNNYQGIKNNIYDLWDLQITIGGETHRTRVFNRNEPDIFKDVRKMLEESGRNELGLWAIEFSTEKLIDMANTATLLGKKLYDERDVKYGNLDAALKSFKEAKWYLETVEPKPEFYPEIISYINECKDALERKYEDQNFLAERAIKLREWERAAAELRILCQIIPERDDKRNQEARAKLLDVESRIKKQ